MATHGRHPWLAGLVLGLAVLAAVAVPRCNRDRPEAPKTSGARPVAPLGWQSTAGASLVQAAEREEAASARREPAGVPGVVVGTLTSADRRPLAGYVFCEPLGEPPLVVDFRVAADKDGAYRFEGIEPGGYRILAALSPVLGFCYSEPFLVGPGQTVRVEPVALVPRPVARRGERLGLGGQLWLRGRQDRPARPWARAGVRVLAYDDRSYGVSTISDVRGEFAFHGLEDRIYTVLIGMPGYRAEPGNRFRAGRADAHVVVVHGDWGINGDVRDSRGQTIDAFKVTILERHGELVIVRGWVAGRRGAYRFPNLPPGEYDLLFEAEGFETQVVRTGKTEDRERVDVWLRRERR